MTESPRLLVARKGLPVNNLQELVAHMKANQATMQYSSAGVGSGTHLPCALFNHVVGLKIEHIPFRGAGQEFRIEAVPGTQIQRYTVSVREPLDDDVQAPSTPSPSFPSSSSPSSSLTAALF